MYIFIDGDTLVYKAAGSAQKVNKETKEIEVGPVEHAIANAKRVILKILEKTQAKDYRLFLTASNDETSFRKLKYNAYKANRAEFVRPVHYHAVREYYIKHWHAEVVSTIEADDAVTICYFESQEQDKCIVGIDKDLKNSPILLYNPDKDIWEEFTEFDALKHFWLQILEGDVSDNVPRIKKGWGRKKEEKEIKKEIYACTDIDKIIKLIYNEFKKIYDCPKEEIQKRGELLWMMRKPEDYWVFEYDAQ